MSFLSQTVLSGEDTPLMKTLPDRTSWTAVVVGYCSAPFLRQQVNWTAKLPQEVKDELDEEM